MRTLLTTTLTLATTLLLGSLTTTQAEASFSITIGNPAIYADCDDDIDEEDLMVIADDEVGYWRMTSSGHWVFRYRKVWYDGDRDAWNYGPWMVNLSIGYGCYCNAGYHRYCPYHGVRYGHYVRSYPTVYDVHYGHGGHRHEYDHRPFYRLQKMPRVEYRVERRYDQRNHADRFDNKRDDNQRWGRPDNDHQDRHQAEMRKQPSQDRREHRGGRLEGGHGNNRQSQVVQTRTTTVRNPSGTTVVRNRTTNRESVRQR